MPIFFYNHSLSFTDEQQTYSYVPLFFDSYYLCTWFLNGFKIFFTFLFMIAFIPYLVYLEEYNFYFRLAVISFMNDEIKVYYYNKKIAYQTDKISLLNYIIDNVIKNKLSWSWHLSDYLFLFSTWLFGHITDSDFEQLLRLLSSLYGYALAYVLFDDKKMLDDDKLYDKANKEYWQIIYYLAKNIFYYYDFFLKKTYAFCRIFLFILIVIFCDYMHIFFDKKQKPDCFFKRFFYYHYAFNETLKGIFQSLPIINNHYYAPYLSWTSLFNFIYFLTALIVELLFDLIIFSGRYRLSNKIESALLDKCYECINKAQKNINNEKAIVSFMANISMNYSLAKTQEVAMKLKTLQDNKRFIIKQLNLLAVKDYSDIIKLAKSQIIINNKGKEIILSIDECLASSNLLWQLCYQNKLFSLTKPLKDIKNCSLNTL